jgi:DNA-binding CsgD family transcriptional regulator
VHGAPVSEHAEGRRQTLPLVDRAAEREAIDRVLAEARHGRSAALVLSGPPGIGKSSLVDYALDSAADFRTLRVTGVESEMAFGYGAIHQLVLPIVGRIAGLPEPQRGALDAAFGAVHHVQLDPFLVGLAALNLVAEEARHVSVLIIIDDAQWLDDESATVLSFLGRRLHAERVAMLVAQREVVDGPARFDGLDRLQVGGLPTPEAVRLLASASVTPVEPDVALRLVEATQGNPLALVELPAALTAEQLSGAAPLPDPLPIGERLSSVFTARLQAVDADTSTVLLLAAAERLGDPRLLRRAAEVHGDVLWEVAMAKAESTGLVRFTPAVQFRHPLVRSAIYYASSAADRRRAHAALAAALDGEGDVDRRAWHLGAAAEGPDESVARALAASADRARLRGGSSATASYLWRAAELTPDPERAAERLLEAARADLLGGRGSRARDMLERARANGLAERHWPAAAWTEALVNMVAGNVREPATLMADALPNIRDDERALAIGATVAGEAAALIGGHLVDPSVRQAVAAGSLAAVDRCHVPDPIGQVVAGLATALAGDRAGSISDLRRATAAATGDPARFQQLAGRSVHVVYLDTILAAADVLDERAWDDLSRAWVQLARRIGALAVVPLGLSFTSWLEVLQGRFGSAASDVGELEDVVSVTGSRGLVESPARAEVLRTAWQADEETTRAGVRRMLREARDRGHGTDIDHGHVALTVLELGAGRYDAALRAARHVYDHDNIVLGTLALPDLVEAAVRAGETDLAHRALERLEARASTSATPWALGLLARSRALVADGGEADDHFRASSDALSVTTIATDLARTQLLHGEWLRRARRRKEAREPLYEALQLFESIGAEGFAARARAELTATGEHVRSRSAPLTVLTPQEAQIARLAAAGERNHEIAAQLYITTSTVEYHLRKIFMKLGVTSRTQLAHVDLPT